MKVERILETILYARDLETAERFYTQILGMEVHSRQPDRHVFFRCGSNMFLLFNPEHTASEAHSSHGCFGRGHIAWAVAEDDLHAWRAHLQNAGVKIESEVAWPAGGHSIYFRDPAGNSLELATPSVWGMQ